MSAKKRKKTPEVPESSAPSGTNGTNSADENAEPENADREHTPRPRTPVEVFDDMIERRKHPTPDPDDEHEDPGLAWEREHPGSDSEFGRIRGFQRQGGSLAPTNSHRGRASSWVAVFLACVGFIMAGLGVAMGMHVVLLVIAGVLLVAAAVVAVVFDMVGDVVLDTPHTEPEEPHDTPLHRIKSKRTE